MTKEFTTKFFSWAKQNELNYESIASKLNNKAATIKNWNSIGIPKGKQFACQALMDNHAKSNQESLPNRIHIEFTDEEFNTVELAAGIVQAPFRDYCRRAVVARAMQDAMTKELDAPTYPFEVLTSLAAGSGITSDNSDTIHITKEYRPNFKGARVRGDSMESNYPDISIPDGSIAVINTHWEGKPYARKNQIYAWTTPEGDMIKKFVRRKVDGKTQGFLESLNPAYTPIPYEETMIPQGEYVEILSQ